MKVMASLKACREIPIVLVIFLFFASPLFFSQKLTTVCNLFQPKQHKALSPKVNPMELGMGLTSGPVPENGDFAFASSPIPNLSVLAPFQPNSPPLRC
jgi:hypothetical protein